MIPAGHVPAGNAHATLNYRAYTVAARIGVGVLAVSLFVFAVVGQWIGAAVVVPFLLASAVALRLEPRLPPLFACLFVWTAVVNAGGYAWGLYSLLWFYDEVVHGGTIFAITLTGGYLTFQSVAPAFAAHRALFIIAISSFGIAVGALWEVFEWTFGFVGPIRDTMIDLILDALGAVGAALLTVFALPANPVDARSSDQHARAKRNAHSARTAG